MRGRASWTRPPRHPGHAAPAGPAPSHHPPLSRGQPPSPPTRLCVRIWSGADERVRGEESRVKRQRKRGTDGETDRKSLKVREGQREERGCGRGGEKENERGWGTGSDKEDDMREGREQEREGGREGGRGREREGGRESGRERATGPAVVGVCATVRHCLCLHRRVPSPEPASLSSPARACHLLDGGGAGAVHDGGGADGGRAVGVCGCLLGRASGLQL